MTAKIWGSPMFAKGVQAKEQAIPMTETFSKGVQTDNKTVSGTADTGGGQKNSDGIIE